jgi:hypothetical protein
VNLAQSKAIRGTVILFSVAAWLSLSNHCAVAAVIGAKAQPSGMHCHDTQPAPAKNDSGEEMPCCKVLRATIITQAQAPVADLTVFSPAIAWISRVLSFDDRHIQSVSYQIDTGPPFVSSFAELILQRSLLSHAPPSLA